MLSRRKCKMSVVSDTFSNLQLSAIFHQSFAFACYYVHLPVVRLVWHEMISFNIPNIEHKEKIHSRDTITIFRQKWLLRHVHFSDCEREGDDNRDKLPNYRSNVSDDTEQGDLNGSKPFNCLHHLTKYPESEDHSIEAIQVASYGKGPIVWIGWRPRDHSQQKGAGIDKQSDEVQTVPGISDARKWEKELRRCNVKSTAELTEKNLLQKDSSWVMSLSAFGTMIWK